MQYSHAHTDDVSGREIFRFGVFSSQTMFSIIVKLHSFHRELLKISNRAQVGVFIHPTLSRQECRNLENRKTTYFRSKKSDRSALLLYTYIGCKRRLRSIQICASRVLDSFSAPIRINAPYMRILEGEADAVPWSEKARLIEFGNENK